MNLDIKKVSNYLLGQLPVIPDLLPKQQKSTFVVVSHNAPELHQNLKHCWKGHSKSHFIIIFLRICDVTVTYCWGKPDLCSLQKIIDFIQRALLLKLLSLKKLPLHKKCHIQGHLCKNKFILIFAFVRLKG